MVRAVAAAALLSLLWLAPAATATDPAPWKVAGDVELALADADTALILGDAADGACERRVGRARRREAARRVGRKPCGSPNGHSARPRPQSRPETQAAFATARALVWTTILRASLLEATASASSGDVESGAELAARPRVPAPDAVLARRSRRDRRARRARGGNRSPRRRPLRPSAATSSTRTTRGSAPLSRACETPTSRDSPPRAPRWARSRSATGGSSRPPIADARGTRGRAHADGLVRAARPRRTAAPPRSAHRSHASRRALAAFRAAPLTEAELVQRAGQLDRFLRLVPIEYGRGVKDGRVTLDFEIQEAVTFRDGAASAFTDLAPRPRRERRARDRPPRRRARRARNARSADAARGDAVADRRRRQGDDRRGARR